jgi:hypothetical protein
LRLRLLLAVVCACTLVACSARDSRVAEAPPTTAAPIATGDYPVLGHAADFSWIAGRVERDLSCTYLRFGSAKHAPWGGRVVVIVSNASIDALQAGDTVVLKGTLERLAFGTCGSPAYLVSSIEEH